MHSVLSRFTSAYSCLILSMALLTSTALLFVVSSDAKIDPATAAAIWDLDGNGKDSSGKNVNGNDVGNPKGEQGIVGKALRFDGKKDGLKFPDSGDINVTNGPWTNRTIVAFFNSDNVKIKDRKQTIYEEGGRTRGLVLYVFDGKVYVAGWNRAEYNWPGAWPSADVESKRWYHVALVIRDAKDKVEKDKFEMWLDGKLIAQEKGGQLHNHGDDIGIGYVNQNTVFHDEDGSGTDIHHFEGLIDEVAVYGAALEKADFEQLASVLAVEPQDKFTTTWGKIKSQRLK